MTKLSFILIITLLCSTTFAQNSGLNTIPLNSCTGAINIFDDGNYQLQFTGKNADKKTLESYPALAEINSGNFIWISFISEQDGEITFDASKESGFLQMVIFKQYENDICGEISSGAAEIKRLYLTKDQTKVGLNYEIGGGTLYSLPLNKGKKIQVLFVTEKGVKDKLNLDWKFMPSVPIVSESKIVDRRNDDFATTFRIVIKDRKTNLPLIASVTLNGRSSISGSYVGSEFLFNVDKNCELAIKCDSDGYFFNDRVEKISSFKDKEVEIYMDKISSGTSKQIEEIEFTPGTSEFTKSSLPKLNRLKDFLALNSNLNIEIQGHVFALGKNTHAGQKISEARAKRVMRYLIDNGIDKSRLSSVGYGNTKPIYAKPKTSSEEQSNRRVEIVVL
ncbi:MAG: OmpA family protein [Crocinitomicaceae bacterium]|nr:OmpA family protein [Crocinitomicaceae bacterium]